MSRNESTSAEGNGVSLEELVDNRLVELGTEAVEADQLEQKLFTDPQVLQFPLADAVTPPAPDIPEYGLNEMAA